MPSTFFDGTNHPEAENTMFVQQNGTDQMIIRVSSHTETEH